MNRSHHSSSSLVLVWLERRVWGHLGWRDLKSRYARTIVGPWWSSANLLTIVIGSSLAVGLLSKTTVFSEAPRIALSLTIWTLISASLNEAVETFEAERSLLLNSQFSEGSLVVRVIWRNLLIYAHNLTVVLLVFVISSSSITLRLLILVPVSVLLGAGLLFPAYLFARSLFILRDFKVILPSSIQFIFFLTPILWIPPDSGPMKLVTELNPVAWVLEFTRLFIFEHRFNSQFAIRSLIFSAASLWFFNLGSKSVSSVRRML
jgi:ABC-type polysaccharide/polyol phosphate export permease